MARIHTRTIWQWSVKRKQYVKVLDEFYNYSGPVALTCGASAQQTQIANAQTSFYTQLQSQATAEFGAASGVFQGLMNTFAPIVAAGPSQQGFSQQENANLNSQAITQVGANYANAKAAVGNAEAAEGGGNVDLPSGAAIGTNLGLAESAANQTSSEESQITQANYAQGNKNYEEAVAGEEAAPGVFSTSSGASNAATEGGNAASSTANQIAQENNSWVNAAIGALGGIAGSAVGGWAKGLGSNQTGYTNSANTSTSGYADNGDTPG